jgi:hypothetical protein
MRSLPAWLGFALLIASSCRAQNLDEVVRRMDGDVAAGKPLVAQVIVALCDNQYQGIVPVPAQLGHGDDPKTNLYWGAMYGVKSWFRRSREWASIAVARSPDPRVLERVLFKRVVQRAGKSVPVYLLAEAWNGRHIDAAIQHFLELGRGQHVAVEALDGGDIAFGGAAHLVAFVGHNGLMDFPAPKLRDTAIGSDGPRATVVLACFSDRYFTPLFTRKAAPLLMTTGLMAPEAYSLDAAVTHWFTIGRASDAETAAAQAYARHQKISERAAQRLFITPVRPAP